MYNDEKVGPLIGGEGGVMYCKYCGELLDDDAAFCTKCGNSLKKGQVSEHPDTSNNECETEQEIETNENSLNNIIDTPNDLNTPEDVNAEGKRHHSWDVVDF